MPAVKHYYPLPKAPKGMNKKTRRLLSKIKSQKTRKNIEHATFDRKDRIEQAALAGQAILDQIALLQRAGLLPPPPPERVETNMGAGGRAAANVVLHPDPMDQILDLDQALIVLHNAADQAGDPEPLHNQINAQALNTLRTRCIVKYTVGRLIRIFMVLALSFYSQFPIHAAPRETSLFDVAASHLSLAGTVTGFMSLPSSGILTGCAVGAKVLGKTVRNRNAASGRFPNAPGEAERRFINVMEYDPTFGTPISVARMAGAAVGVGIDRTLGKKVGIIQAGSTVFGSTAANIITNLGSRIGKPNNVSLKAAAKVLGKGKGKGSD